MDYYNEQTDIYDLGDNISLIKAEQEEFSKFFMFYRQGIMPYENYDKFNSLVKKDLAVIYNNLFWLYDENIRIAGLIMSPNSLASLFFIPSKKHPDNSLIIHKLDEILSLWSVKDKPIQIKCNSEFISEIFTSFDYKVVGKRYAMLKPTHDTAVKFDQKYNVSSIKKHDIPDVARFLCNAHIGSPDDTGVSDEAVNKKIAMLEYFFNAFDINNTSDCSCMVIDYETDQIIGACIAGKDDSGLAAIIDVAVLHNCRGQGLATNMLNRAIGIANKTCQAIFLGVTEKSNAYRLYQSLGFYEYAVHITLQR